MAHFFITRPIFAMVLSIVIVMLGRRRDPRASRRAVPADLAATHSSADDVYRCERSGRGAVGRVGDRKRGRRRRQSDLHAVDEHVQRPVYAQLHLQGWRRHSKGADRRAEPRRTGDRKAARIGQPIRHHGSEEIAADLDGPSALLADQLVRPALSQQLHDAQPHQPIAFGSGHRRREHHRGSGLRDARLGASRSAGEIRSAGERPRRRRGTSRTCSSRPAPSVRCRPRRTINSSFPSTHKAGSSIPNSSAISPYARIPTARCLRLRDVARVELGAQLYQTLGTLNGKPATLVILYQTPDANALTTAKAVSARMEQLSKAFPPSLKYPSLTTARSSSQIPSKTSSRRSSRRSRSSSSSSSSFWEASAPRSFRCWPCPCRSSGRSSRFLPLGFSVNTLTLFGLVLAIGIVVDDAIVVVEGVEHHIEAGLEPLAAVEQAMKELTAPILGISLVLTSVFLPSAFISGITGQLYRQFALTITISVNLSAIVALTLTPALCAIILRKRTRMWGPFGWFIDRFNEIFGAVTTGYMGAAELADAARDTRRRTTRRLLRARCAARHEAARRLRAGRGSRRRLRLGAASVRVVAWTVTRRSSGKMENDLKSVHGVADVISLAGYNLLTFDSDAGLVELHRRPQAMGGPRTKEHLTLHDIIKRTSTKR